MENLDIVSKSSYLEYNWRQLLTVCSYNYTYAYAVVFGCSLTLTHLAGEQRAI